MFRTNTHFHCFLSLEIQFHKNKHSFSHSMLFFYLVCWTKKTNKIVWINSTHTKTAQSLCKMLHINHHVEEKQPQRTSNNKNSICIHTTSYYLVSSGFFSFIFSHILHSLCTKFTIWIWLYYSVPLYLHRWRNMIWYMSDRIAVSLMQYKFCIILIKIYLNEGSSWNWFPFPLGKKETI